MGPAMVGMCHRHYTKTTERVRRREIKDVALQIIHNAGKIEEEVE